MAKKSKKSKKNTGMEVVPWREDRERKSVSVRKIDNGYLAEHDESGPDGYKSKTVYHPKKPAFVLEPAPTKKLTARGVKKLEKMKI